MESLLYIIAGIILLPFLLNPIVLKIKLRDYYEPALEEMSEQVLPREVKNYFDSKADELEQLEFKHCTDAVLKNCAGTAEIYTSLWFNRQKGILDTKPNIYRLAWKGALINGWQFAWPVKDIRKRLLIKNAQKIIASLPK
jgi:hypothetical protein